jgi:hypothetical protein
MKTLCLGVTLLAAGLCSHAQNLLPDPGFEEGRQQPAGWRLADGAGEWARSEAAGASRVLRARGNGQDQSVWRTEALRLKPGGLYALRFRGRRLPDASGGTALAGTSRVNRDFPLDAEWREYRFVFRQPDDVKDDFIRLGQWHVKGAVEFDDAELLPVLAGHLLIAGPGGRETPLGEAEQVRQGVYRFAPSYGWEGAAFHRPLWRGTAGFNSDRWLFTPGGELSYRFALPGCAQTSAQVSVAINYHVAGSLLVEASRDGEQWTRLGAFDGRNRGGTCKVPATWLPAKDIFVRLRTPDPGTSLQVSRCEYEARLDAAALEAEGETRFIEVTGGRAPELISWRGFSKPEAAGQRRFDFTVTNPGSKPLRVTASLTGPAGVVRTGRTQRFAVTPGESRECTLELGLNAAGEPTVTAAFLDGEDQALLAGRSRLRVGFLEDSSYGYRLAGSSGLDLWWCESGWKVGRDRPPPVRIRGRRVDPVKLSAARGEFEAVQLVLRPAQGGTLRGLDWGGFRGAAGNPAPIKAEVTEVAYVHITHPTDSTGQRGWHPDPLPPLTLPRALEPGVNVPFWVTIHVPRGIQTGDYTAGLTLKLDVAGRERTLRVPFAVCVYDFELPRETHLRSALGLGTGAINQYHKLANRADQIAVFEKYLQNFAEHRISPYSFFDYAPIDVRFVGEGADKRARVDFAAFEAAASRWLGTGSADGPVSASPFNTFQLPLRGMGGGTFHSRHPGELEGCPEGTPEHARLFADYLGQVERRLRERGWLDKAFTYWFDEPDPKDYEFVVAGQQRIRAAAPGLKRLLTEQPEPELIGHVDIWCGLTPEWTPEKVRARRAAGEEVWWYICTAPKAPYVTEFIDHPGTELRLWPWQSWQYGVTGILIWATIYWHSPEAYPDALQNPWEDPMSWVTSYGTPKGTRSPWGNGDGRFLYPPRRDPNTATAPCLDGPINSIRWENLRDGMEDYEYFWLLDQEVKRLSEMDGERLKGEAAGRTELLSEAKALLVVPERISKDLTHFTTDPRPMLEHRDTVARMIERLRRIR